ncbi:MAG: DUF3644 domain-containing protein [Pseudomonadota bacterium]
MILRGGYQDQDIQSFFTRPSRTINHARIKEIRDETKHKAVKAADDETLDAFLAMWPDIDPDTGLNLRGDELLIKAREAMIAGVHTFNSAGLTFRAELFIVTAIIAWTYLLHAWFKREGVDYRYAEKKTKGGAEKFWELGKCLRHSKCPVSAGAAKNLEILLDLRHEIEHRSTSRIDDALGAKLQACAINFNSVLKSEFGAQHGLEKRLPIALQFVSFAADQRAVLKKTSDLPAHVAGVIDAFEHGLSREELENPAYRFKVGFLPLAAKKPGAADAAVEIVTAGSEDATAIERIIFKDRDRDRYTTMQVLRVVQDRGFPRFSVYNHTKLFQQLDAKNPGKGYGRKGDYKNTWVWFDRWIERVIEFCEAEGDRFK